MFKVETDYGTFEFGFRRIRIARRYTWKRGYDFIDEPGGPKLTALESFATVCFIKEGDEIIEQARVNCDLRDNFVKEQGRKKALAKVLWAMSTFLISKKKIGTEHYPKLKGFRKLFWEVYLGRVGKEKSTIAV